MKKTGKIVMLSLICLGLAVAGFNFLSVPAYADEVIFGTRIPVFPPWVEICWGTPSDCVVIIVK